MSVESQLRARSASTCEICTSSQNLGVFLLTPLHGTEEDSAVLTCQNCRDKIEATAPLQSQDFYGLKDSIWSEHPAVQVLSYRLLKRLGPEAWAQELLGQVYLDESLQAWADAESAPAAVQDSEGPRTVDSNGTVLSEGDTVTLIKDLDVKGANFTAKRGTTVKGISLTDDPKYIEGKINGTRIVLVAAYLKKA